MCSDTSFVLNLILEHSDSGSRFCTTYKQHRGACSPHFCCIAQKSQLSGTFFRNKTEPLLILVRHTSSKFLVDSWSPRETCRSLGRNLRIKGETGHHKFPTDTKANKHLLLSAGEQPMPQGSSRIKRSPERLMGQGVLSKVCTMTHAVSHSISSGV